MGRSIAFLGCLAVLLLSLVPATSEDKPKESCIPQVIAEFQGKVVGVSDGDTITVLNAQKEQIKIRLEGIDAPESTQTNGQKAKQALSDLVFGKTVTVKKTGQDRYGRTLALIYLDDRHINDEMVKAGWAWQFTQYNCEDRVKRLEAQAREGKKGLWATPNPIAPWDYRARQKQAVAKKPTPVGTPATAESSMKFWLNTNSNIRHNPRCEWFNNTKKGRFCGPGDGKACAICGG
jgi:micrococcal nuclease